MSLVISGVAQAGVDDIEITPYPFRTMSMKSCRRSISAVDSWAVDPWPAATGIAFLTVTSERYPEIWAATLNGPRLRASQFGSTVHNSGSGAVAIALGLRGPQVTLVAGDILQAAKLQILAGRTRMMVVCACELMGPAISMVLHSTDDPGIPFETIEAVGRDEPSTAYGLSTFRRQWQVAANAFAGGIW